MTARRAKRPSLASAGSFSGFQPRSAAVAPAANRKTANARPSTNRSAAICTRKMTANSCDEGGSLPERRCMMAKSAAGNTIGSHETGADLKPGCFRRRRLQRASSQPCSKTRKKNSSISGATRTAITTATTFSPGVPAASNCSAGWANSGLRSAACLPGIGSHPGPDCSHGQEGKQQPEQKEKEHVLRLPGNRPPAGQGDGRFPPPPSQVDPDPNGRAEGLESGENRRLVPFLGRRCGKQRSHASEAAVFCLRSL